MPLIGCGSLSLCVGIELGRADFQVEGFQPLSLATTPYVRKINDLGVCPCRPIFAKIPCAFNAAAAWHLQERPSPCKAAHAFSTACKMARPFASMLTTRCSIAVMRALFGSR